MADDGITEAVKRFISDHIRSATQLEILLLIRSQGTAAMAADVVARELRINTEWAARELHGLTERGILVEQPGSPPAYGFAPASTELKDTIDALDAAYRERQFTVIDLIFNKPSDPARAFADAFHFRRK